jgi:glycosyltransferase involved in cell wall biosynthesis
MNLGEDYPSLVFEGNMSFGPSVDAIAYFCREVFPIITSRIPEIRLSIVGRDPTEDVRRLQSERVVVTGKVDDVRPYLDRASVFICPMRKGAGIKNKLLQAWSMAKAVVATSVATGGLAAVHEENVLIADDSQSFANEIIRILQSPQMRKTIGINGRHTVVRYYTWERQVQQLEAWMSSH